MAKGGLPSEGGEWIWLPCGQSRPGQSKPTSAILPCCPKGTAAAAMQSGILTDDGLGSNNTSPWSLACRQLAGPGPLASNASLVTQGLLLAPARYPITTPSRVRPAHPPVVCTESQYNICVMFLPMFIGIHPEQKAKDHTGSARATSRTNLLGRY